MFEISQIKCFVAVAEELHFGRAAKRLNMTQSPLSRQIQLLEHAVGAQLLDRERRAVQLTAAGKAFLPAAAHILRLSQEAIVTAQRIAKGDAGALTLGFTAGLGVALIPAGLARLRFDGVVMREIRSHSRVAVEAAVAYRQADANPVLKLVLQEVLSPLLR